MNYSQHLYLRHSLRWTQRPSAHWSKMLEATVSATQQRCATEWLLTGGTGIRHAKSLAFRAGLKNSPGWMQLLLSAPRISTVATTRGHSRLPLKCR